jgi:hypothetical protein
VRAQVDCTLLLCLCSLATPLERHLVVLLKQPLSTQGTCHLCAGVEALHTCRRDPNKNGKAKAVKKGKVSSQTAGGVPAPAYAARRREMAAAAAEARMKALLSATASQQLWSALLN